MAISRTRLLLLAILLFVPLVAAVVAGPRIFDRSDAADPAIRLKVDLSERRLYVIDDGKVVRTYGVAVGSRKHPTPKGTFRTGRIIWNPRWVPPPREWARNMRPRKPGDPRNPMQGVKIFFREPWYFIHGTNDPESIGKAASRGCIRMREGDAKALARTIEKHGSVPLVIQA